MCSRIAERSGPARGARDGKDDFDIEVCDSLIVRGEKRFEREAAEGRYRIRQCAYGTFYRAIPLPAYIFADKVKAIYRNGVPKIVLPKANRAEARAIDIKVGYTLSLAEHR
jgi:HSP20 family protein